MGRVDVYRGDSVRKPAGHRPEVTVLTSRLHYRGSRVPPLFSLIEQPPSAESYEEIARRLDLVSFVDYLLVNAYAATSDWPNANWVTARPRASGGRFRFYVWDAEGAFGNGGAKGPEWDTIAGDLETVESPICSLYRGLVRRPEFRRLFSARYRYHTRPGGALSDQNVSRRFGELRSAVAGLVESLRDEPFDTSIVDVWLPARPAHLERSLRRAGLVEEVPAPEAAPAIATGAVMAPFRAQGATDPKEV